MYTSHPYVNYYHQQQSISNHQHVAHYYQYEQPQHHEPLHNIPASQDLIEQQFNDNGAPINYAKNPRIASNWQYMNPECTANYDPSAMQSEVSMVCAPPEWAVQAKGESRLEPIGETAISHMSVDLSAQRWFRIGRSPVSDIPLLHTTSSRNHALIFHHPSGACYLVDCKSVHGTFVDGVRIESYPHPPKKVRRGALIRFGGPDAPTFVLKRFSNEFNSFVRDMDYVAHSFSTPQHYQHIYCPENTPCLQSQQPTVISESSSEEEEEVNQQQDDIVNKKLSVRSHYFRHPQHWIHHIRSNEREYASKDLDILACIRGDGGGVACIAEYCDAPNAALLLLNTRINALGERGASIPDRRNLIRKVKNRFSYISSITQSQVLKFDDDVDKHILRKRSRSDSFSSCSLDSSSNPNAEQSEKRYKSILTTKSSIPSLQVNATDCNLSLQPTQTNTTRITKVRFNEENNESYHPQPVTPDDLSLEDR